MVTRSVSEVVTRSVSEGIPAIACSPSLTLRVSRGEATPSPGLDQARVVVGQARGYRSQDPGRISRGDAEIAEKERLWDDAFRRPGDRPMPRKCGSIIERSNRIPVKAEKCNDHRLPTSNRPATREPTSNAVRRRQATIRIGGQAEHSTCGKRSLGLALHATHWALDVASVCQEIGYSIAWMRAFACYWSECEGDHQRSVERLVSYYADNAATRISSCRDKLALLAWSYYCPFNPDKKDEVLSFAGVRDRLAHPIRFGLHLDGCDEFLAELNKLDGPDFRRAATYRHKKVHRMEPRVTMRKPEVSDQPSYMFALVTDTDVRRFDDKLKEMYQADGSAIRKRCFVDGVLFDRRSPEELFWRYGDFDGVACACWRNLCDATAGSCEILLRREPMLSKDKRSVD